MLVGCDGVAIRNPNALLPLAGQYALFWRRYCPARGNTRLSSRAVAMALPFATRTRYCPLRGNTRFLAQLLPRKGQYAALRGYLAPTGRNTPRFLHATRRSR